MRWQWTNSDQIKCLENYGKHDRYKMLKYKQILNWWILVAIGSECINIWVSGSSTIHNGCYWRFFLHLLIWQFLSAECFIHYLLLHLFAHVGHIIRLLCMFYRAVPCMTSWENTTGPKGQCSTLCRTREELQTTVDFIIGTCLMVNYQYAIARRIITFKMFNPSNRQSLCQNKTIKRWENMAVYIVSECNQNMA